MKTILSVIIGIGFSSAAHSSTFVPMSCKYLGKGSGAGGIQYAEIPCNQLHHISNKINPIEYSNACVFKNSTWQLGRLIFVPSRGKYKFIVEKTCDSGIMARNTNPMESGVRGPNKHQSQLTTQKVKSELDVKHPAGPHVVYDSSHYFSVSPNSNMVLTDVKKNDILVACRTHGGENTLPCVNSDLDTSPNSVGYCEQRDLGTVGRVYGKSGEAYKGRWYVRYNQKFQSDFDVCRHGVRVADAKVLANTNSVDILNMISTAKIGKSTFLNTYNNGKSAHNGLKNWYGASTIARRYPGISTCYVNNKQRVNCSSKTLIVSASEPSSTVQGRCYSFPNASGSWDIYADTGEDTLQTCSHVEALTSTVVSPD